MGQMLSELLHAGYSVASFFRISVSVSALDAFYEQERGKTRVIYTAQIIWIIRITARYQIKILTLKHRQLPLK